MIVDLLYLKDFAQPICFCGAKIRFFHIYRTIFYNYLKLNKKIGAKSYNLPTMV